LERPTLPHVEIGSVVAFLLARLVPTLGTIAKEPKIRRSGSETVHQLRQHLASELLEPPMIGLTTVRHGGEQGPARPQNASKLRHRLEVVLAGALPETRVRG